MVGSSKRGRVGQNRQRRRNYITVKLKPNLGLYILDLLVTELTAIHVLQEPGSELITNNDKIRRFIYRL
jgi:hypothetical protein